jgi:hypothetical protein
MLKLNHLVGFGAGGDSYDPDAVAFFSAMGTPIAEKFKPIINQLVVDLKAASIWAELDGLYLLTLTTSDQSRLNLVNPSAPGGDGLLTVNGSPTFTADFGWACMGNNTHRLSMSSACGSLANFDRDDGSFGIWIDSPANHNAFACGTFSNQNVIIPNYNGAHTYGRINVGGNTSLSAGGGGTGFKAMDRSDSTTGKIYNNGVHLSTNTSASTATDLGNEFTFLNASNGTALNGGTERIGFIGGSLGDTKQAAFYTAANAFITAYDLAS